MDFDNNSNQSTVLLIDDEAPIRDSGELLLRSEGFTVYTADGASAAFDHIAAGVSPAILLCDYRMPHMDGPQVVRYIREYLAREVPVLMMTGDTSAGVIESCNLSNCDVLRKPFKVDQLIQKIRKAADNPFWSQGLSAIEQHTTVPYSR